MEKEKKNNKWKTIAIIFIVLFILETLLMVNSYMIGDKIMDNEEICSYDVCSDYKSYYYDYTTDQCYCYENGEPNSPIKVEYYK